jgi:2-methylcitrate dehydratase PrpD
MHQCELHTASVIETVMIVAARRQSAETDITDLEIRTQHVGADRQRRLVSTAQSRAALQTYTIDDIPMYRT